METKKQMKKLLFIALIFVSASSLAQITVSTNPTLVAPATTSTREITIIKSFLSDPNNVFFPTLIAVVVKFPSGNSGTAQINTLSSTVTSSPAYAAGTQVFLTVKDTLWIKLSNSADTYEISWF